MAWSTMQLISRSTHEVQLTEHPLNYGNKQLNGNPRSTWKLQVLVSNTAVECRHSNLQSIAFDDVPRHWRCGDLMRF